MSSKNSATPSPEPVYWPAACLLVALAIYFVVRVRWVGHLLTWDEAMSLCSIRSFVSEGRDYFSYWFWRHPPAYKLLLMLIHPLAHGFAERAEWVTIFIGACNIAALFFLNREIYGIRIAFFSAIFLALMPRAIFYDVWIKSDAPVVLLSLMALYLFLSNRLVLAGLALGLAFLSKEMALFYALAIGALWLIQPPADRTPRAILLVAVAAVAVAGWWYASFSVSLRHFFALATGLHIADVERQTEPWYFYMLKLSKNLSMSGVCICILGVLSIKQRSMALGRHHRDYPDQVWPLALLVPSYLFLELIGDKSTHFDMVLDPGWATLEALGLAMALEGLTNLLATTIQWSRTALHTIEALICAATFGHMAGLAATTDYEQFLGFQNAGMLWGSSASRESALAMNRAMAMGEHILITPMHYWSDETTKPDPIFVYYLRNDVNVVVRPNTLSADELIEAVRTYQIDWAMVSPAPDQVKVLVAPLAATYGLRPLVLKGALIYRTESLRDAGTATNVSAGFFPKTGI